MNNPVQPSVELVFDEKMLRSLAPETRKALGNDLTFEVYFDFEAIATAEEDMKRPLLMGLTQQEVEHPTIAFIRAMLYQGLRTKHATITYEEAAALVTAKTARPIWNAVVVAFANAVQDDEQQEQSADPTTDQG